jgi:hypothetical protein
MIQDMSGLECDYLASNLRSQLNLLQNVLTLIESQQVDCDYTHNSLKEIEVNLRQIRKMCTCN